MVFTMGGWERPDSSCRGLYLQCRLAPICRIRPANPSYCLLDRAPATALTPNSLKRRIEMPATAVLSVTRVAQVVRNTELCLRSTLFSPIQYRFQRKHGAWHCGRYLP